MPKNIFCFFHLFSRSCFILLSSFFFTILLIPPIQGQEEPEKQSNEHLEEVEMINDECGFDPDRIVLRETCLQLAQSSNRVELINIRPTPPSNPSQRSHNYSSISRGEVNQELFGERVALSEDDLPEISKLLYEYYDMGERLECYSPYHGIVFYDAQDQITGYIEVCFMCNQVKTWGNVPKMISFCTEQEVALIEFFRAHGLEAKDR